MATETEVGELLHQHGCRTSFTVTERVNAWAALVSVIDRGYGDDIYEYTDDLYCRNWLHEAWLLLDEHIVQLWTPQIKALDDRYKAATIDDDGQALDQVHNLPRPRPVVVATPPHPHRRPRAFASLSRCHRPRP
ncbi:hypothetical protein [Streptomyces hyaluromycini]|uniref:hypothetical protein n=1 Tax=Streptomyces hyaluromycini TaxID=1377993 RepID=UPI001237EE4E|nr:hypothetical protein [Streptomyces hyaluromycini]